MIYIASQRKQVAEGVVTTRAIVGTRIRERRRSLGITQAALAREIGISASYLNLIEHNKRAIAGPLLLRTAGALGVGLEDLDAAAERRLLDMLHEVAHLPNLAGLEVETAQTGELIGRYPGWARAVAALARSERSAMIQAQAMADRLTHDPVLSETVHRMLTRISAIRTAAEILTDYPDVPARQREHFLMIIRDESRALSDVGENLASYFDHAETAGAPLTPIDEVEALFEARHNRFDEIETAVEQDGAAPLRTGDAQAMTAARRWQAARESAAQRFLSLIETLLARHEEIASQNARQRARDALLDYAAAAILAPMSRFALLAQECRHDLEALAAAFDLDMTRVCYRMLALPDGPRLGYLRVDAAGSLIERRNLPGLTAPRHAAACPLWVLYRAQQAPGTILRQLARFPGGQSFVFLAFAHCVSPPGFRQPRHYLTDMLAMSESDARATVYAPGPTTPTEEVGPACGICPRQDCRHRRDEPLGG